MKPGEYYLDDYYAPDILLLQVTNDPVGSDGYHCKVVYDGIGVGSSVKRDIDDEDLRRAVVIYMDGQLIFLEL